MHPMEVELDHLVWAVPDLERGVLEIEQLFGATATLGGHHPGVGTRNALIGIGGGRYFEILAPDPDQHAFTGFGRWVAKLTAPRLVTWAARTNDLDVWRDAALHAGLEPGQILEMQRRLPDGSALAWRLLELGVDRQGRLPFCIEWQDKHPTDSLPLSGCSLCQLNLGASGPFDLGHDLDALGFSSNGALHVSRGNQGLVAVFETPRGRVELS